MGTAQATPAILSFLLLAAHVARHGGGLPMVVPLLLIGLLFVPRPWAGRTVQVALLVGALEWGRTLFVLWQQRAARGEPAGRMAVILGAVALLTAASALGLRTRRARVWFRQEPGAPDPGS